MMSWKKLYKFNWAFKSYIETEEESDAVSELEKSVFVLKHIEDKTRMNLKNIF